MRDEIEWLDEEGAPAQPDEELPGGDRPSLRARTKVALAVVAAALVAVAVTLGVVSGGDHSRQAARATPAPSVLERTTSGASPASPTSYGPPRDALAAIRSAFPGAVLQSYVTALGQAGATRRTFIYNMTSGRRAITVSVAPLKSSDTDLVSRIGASIELGQQLGPAFVDIVVKTSTGRPSAGDFAAMQDLVQDARVLAQR